MSAHRKYIDGERSEILKEDTRYPAALLRTYKPPECLYVLGNPCALVEGLAVIGTRKATPYGLSCARRFAGIAAKKGIVVISGAARGCDSAAHEAALAAATPTVAFLGSGCNHIYPAENAELFQRIVDAGGALVSEYAWDTPPLPYMFRARNRLIAALAKATLIVEAGLPSGTFSTADEALAANRDVLVVPGAITAPTTQGVNRLLYQGAVPIVDNESFEEALCAIFGTVRQPATTQVQQALATESADPIVEALRTEPLMADELMPLAQRLCEGNDPVSWLLEHLAQAELAGTIARYSDGRYGPVMRS